MDRELIHDRLRATRRAIDPADVAQEHERLARLGSRGPRRQSHPDHVRLRVRPVNRVVAVREQREVRRGGDVSACGVLLRRPVEARVHLVADDEIVDAPLVDRLDDVPRPIAELDRIVGRSLQRVEDDDDPHSGRLGHRRRALEERQLLDRGGVARIECDRPAVLGQARALELVVEPCPAVVGELRRVVGSAPRDVRRARARCGDRPGARGGDEKCANECEESSKLHTCPFVERPSSGHRRSQGGTLARNMVNPVILSR